MKIISKNIIKCKHCGYYWGTVEEKYNGLVPVFCSCDLKANKDRGYDPVIVGYDKDILRWRPISNYLDENGQSWHVPYFANMALESRLRKLKNETINQNKKYEKETKNN